MGYHKDRMIQEDDQGWRFRDGETVCLWCVKDSYLRAQVTSTANQFRCSFCGRSAKNRPIAITFNELMEMIGGAIWQYHNHAVNCMGWEDGEYVGTTYDSYDLVRYGIPTPSYNEELLKAITESLGDQAWCDRDPYSLSDVDRYLLSWDQFCETVKHRVRFFFDSQTVDDEHSERIPVPQMLDALRGVIDDAGLVTELPAGTRIYRVRVHGVGETCDDWRSLGSPPDAKAPSNRMSAAGISMLYAAFDLQTARVETIANVNDLSDQRLTCATWTNTRPLFLLDLTRLPKVPSFYAQVRYERDQLIFLWNFVESITQPVLHDGREHIDYVPSQIVTEYFRHRYELFDKRRLDGIVYPSARKRRGKSLVIFASQTDLDSCPNEWTHREPILRIDPSSIHRLKRPRLRRTRHGNGSQRLDTEVD